MREDPAQRGNLAAARERGRVYSLPETGAGERPVRRLVCRPSTSASTHDLVRGGFIEPMHRLFVIALVLAEFNFRCVRDEVACDEEKQACSEDSESETGETEGAPPDLPD